MIEKWEACPECGESGPKWNYDFQLCGQCDFAGLMDLRRNRAKRILDKAAQENTVHVTPEFGRQHHASTECWCRPKPLPEEPRVFVHNPEN